MEYRIEIYVTNFDAEWISGARGAIRTRKPIWARHSECRSYASSDTRAKYLWDSHLWDESIE